MAINYIPGPEATLGPAFGQLAESLIDFLNPQKKFRDAALVSIMQDPTNVQRFADLEAAQPGFLNRIGLAGLAGQPSVEAQFAAENRPEMLELKRTSLQNELADKKITSQKLQILNTALKNPNFSGKDFGDILRGQFSLPRQDVSRTEAATATITEEQAKAAPAIEGARSSLADLQTRITEAQQKVYSTKETVTLDDIMTEGKFTPLEQAAIFGSPLGQGLLEAGRLQADRDRLAWQQFGDNDSYKRLKRQQAYQYFANIGIPAPLEVYESALEGEGLELIRVDESKLNPRQKQLVAIHKAAASIEPAKKAAQLNQVRDDIRSTIASYDAIAKNPEYTGKKGDAQRKVIANALNDLFAAQSALRQEPQRYFVSYNREERTALGFIPFGSRADLKIVDANNNVRTLDEAVINAPVLPPVKPPVKTPPGTEDKVQASKDVKSSLSGGTTAPSKIPPKSTIPNITAPEALKARYDAVPDSQKPRVAAQLLAQAPNDSIRRQLRTLLNIPEAATAKPAPAPAPVLPPEPRPALSSKPAPPVPKGSAFDLTATPNLPAATATKIDPRVQFQLESNRIKARKDLTPQQKVDAIERLRKSLVSGR